MIIVKLVAGDSVENAVVYDTRNGNDNMRIERHISRWDGDKEYYKIIYDDKEIIIYNALIAEFGEY